MIYNHVTYSLSDLDMRMVRSIPPGGNWQNIPKSIPSKRLEQIRKSGGRTTLYGRMEWNKPSYTITTYFNRPGNGTYIHPEQDRVISAREAARFQSFPDNFIFLGAKTNLLKLIGNAVPPLLAYFIARKIKNKTKTKNVLDLFCGAGGLSLGFTWAGYKIVAANDNYKPAYETFKKNHKDTIIISGDITKDEIKKRLLELVKDKRIDIVIGGPPCQGFSHAGKRMVDDPRNQLFKEFVQIVKKIKPKVILMENVEGILTLNKERTYKSIQESFKVLGYKFTGHKMHAVKFGVPQKRKRVIIIGVLTGDPEDCFPSEIITKPAQYLTVQDAIQDLPQIKANGGENILDKQVEPKTLYQKLMAGQISIHHFENYFKNL